MHALKHDLTYALRSLARSPGYAAVTVLTLALGIGANTAIFSVVNGVLLKPLPYPGAERLAFITSTFPALGFDRFWISVPEWAEFKERNRSFQAVGAYREGSVNLGTPERPRRVNSALVTTELMSVLGVPPLRGRLFNEPDGAVGAEDVGIIAYATWQSDFGLQESVIGRVVPIDGVPTRIVGIMPRGYDIHDERVEVFLPLTIDPKTFPNNRGSHFLYLIGRLKDGVSPQQAQADLDTMIEQWRGLSGNRHSPNRLPNTTHLLQMHPMKTDMVGSIGTALWVLQGAVGFVLLIACANLANLILARAESRQKEFAIRSALGAGRWRLLKQFLTEGVILALAGGALGAALGIAGLRALLAANPESIPRALEIGLDWKVLLFTLGVSIVTGLIFGMAPLLHLREQVVTISLKEGGQRSTAGSARARVRNGLVMAEVALAVVLVVGAGLLIRSFQKLMTVDPGFNRERMMTFGVVLPGAAYPKPESRVAFFNRLTGRLRELPGVTGVAAMTGLPPNRAVNANDTDFEGYTAPPEGPAENVDYYQTVSLDYLKTMGIPVVKGRGFEPTDISGGPVLLVNETLEKTFYTSRKLEAVGQRVNIFVGPGTAPFTIVGVVRDVKHVEKDRHRALFPARAGTARGDLLPGQHEHRRPLGAPARDARARVPGGRPGAGRHDPDRQDADDGAGVCGFRGAPAVPGRTARHLRGARAGARRDRHLRDPLVFGERADEGDRHPHGARRHARERARDDPGAGDAADDRRTRYRPGRVLRTHTAAAGAAVQRETDGSRDTERGGRLHRRHRVHRLLRSGAAGHARRSDGDAQRVMT
jgi:putative ABC transport system permease protein